MLCYLSLRQSYSFFPYEQTTQGYLKPNFSNFAFKTQAKDGHTIINATKKEDVPVLTHPLLFCGADEARTRDPNLGKVVLYQLSYFRVATRTRLELVTSAVTGRHSNQLNHRAEHKKMVGANGIEPLTFCL